MINYMITTIPFKFFVIDFPVWRHKLTKCRDAGHCLQGLSISRETLQSLKKSIFIKK